MIWIVAAGAGWFFWTLAAWADETAKQDEDEDQALDLVDAWELVPPCLV